MPGKSQREHWEGLGRFLGGVLEREGWTQEQLGVRAGQSRATINRAMSSDEVTVGTAARIADALGLSLAELRAAVNARSGGALTQGAPVIRKTPHTSMPAQPPKPASWPAVARAREQELRAEAARAGLDDEELAAISRTLRDLATAPIFEHGGRPRAMTDEEILEDVEATADALRAWIAVRAKRRRQG